MQLWGTCEIYLLLSRDDCVYRRIFSTPCCRVSIFDTSFEVYSCSGFVFELLVTFIVRFRFIGVKTVGPV